MSLETVILGGGGGGVGLRGLRPPHRQCVTRAASAYSSSGPPSSSSPSWSSTAALRCGARRPRAVVASASAAKSLEREVDLESTAGVSYEALRDALAAGEWEAADAETRRLLCVLAGEGAAKRKWVYYSEVQFIPGADLRTVDRLWRAYSDGKFGYSVQRRIWRATPGGSWTLFFSKVGWTRRLPDSRNDAYKKFPIEFSWDVTDPTPLGHLPLTNALRGTQLLEKLLEHPAFDSDDDDDELLLPDSDGPAVLQPSQQPSSPSSPSTPSKQQQVASDDDLTIDYGF